MLGDDLLRGAAHPGQVPARAVGGAERPGLAGPPPRRARRDPHHPHRPRAGRRVGGDGHGPDRQSVAGSRSKPSGWGTRGHAVGESVRVAELPSLRPAPEQASEPGPGEQRAGGGGRARRDDPRPIRARAEIAWTRARARGRLCRRPSRNRSQSPARGRTLEAIETTQPEPRIGFFARLFRRRKQQPAPEPVAEL